MPEAAAKGIKAFRVLAHQQGLRLPVTALLSHVSPDGRAPVVPDKGRRAETNLQARLLQAPAQVHVVARPVEDRIEPAHLRQRPLVERHVAAGDVLRLAVGQHDVRRAARRRHHRCGHQRVLRRQEIGTTDTCKLALQQTRPPGNTASPRPPGSPSL